MNYLHTRNTCHYYISPFAFNQGCPFALVACARFCLSCNRLYHRPSWMIVCRDNIHMYP
jgi:hypothetical protein